jgi:hypothetical protein
LRFPRRSIWRVLSSKMWRRSPIEIYGRFAGTYCCHHQSRRAIQASTNTILCLLLLSLLGLLSDSKHWDSPSLQNIGKHSRDYMASRSRRWYSLSSTYYHLRRSYVLTTEIRKHGTDLVSNAAQLLTFYTRHSVCWARVNFQAYEVTTVLFKTSPQLPLPPPPSPSQEGNQRIIRCFAWFFLPPF